MELDRASANAEAKERLVTTLEGHGAHLSLEDAVREFPAGLMNEKPPHVPYAFWHQLEHIRIAQWDLLAYATEPDHESPEWPRGYWPARDEATDEDGWNRTIRRIQADRRSFVELIRDPSCDVFAPVDHMDGRSVMRAAMLAIDHTAYHLGEFVMGRQSMGAWRSEPS
jgi:hypothetical protein